jgi:hypothetical protein
MSDRSFLSLPPIDSISAGSRTVNVVAGAATRWQVEKKRAELDKKIEEFYDSEVAKCLTIDKVANEKITRLYNDIYNKVKWSNPPLPATQQKLFTDYCKHLLTVGTKVQFPGVVDLKVWKKKLSSSVHGKGVDDITIMCRKLRDLVEKRNTDLANTQSNLLASTERKNIEKDGTLRWMMETNVSKRDEYFTVWYLASNGKTRELEVLLNAPLKGAKIDDRDPDFGLTPLHYACKTNQYLMLQFLMAKGADLTLRTPDGRTPLHLAAAYGSREMVLELLGACVDYDALDNYGCTALQLAEQNKNVRTVGTLRNWTRLTMLPSELLELDRQQSIASSASQTLYSNRNTAASGTGLAGTIAAGSRSASFFQPGQTSPASPSAWNLELAAAFPPSTEQVIDTSIPEEYQPVAAEALQKMSPTLSLLTKRLNAYNMYLPRSATNYVPTEMLRSRDLSNMSAMLHRSAAAAERGEWGSADTPLLGAAGSGLVGSSSCPEIPVRAPMQLGRGDTAAGSVLQNQMYEGATGGEASYNPGAFDSSVSQNRDGGHTGALQVYESASTGVDGREEHYFDDNYFETQFNECMVEIRLTTKHYALCVQEDLLPEAMRSLRRRWLVAKRLWGLMMLQREQRLRREEQLRWEHEERMAVLWAGPSGLERQYDDEGRPLYLAAGQLEYSSVEGGGDDLVLRLPSELEASDAAVHESLPHPKYLPAVSGASSVSGGAGGGSAEGGIGEEKRERSVAEAGERERANEEEGDEESDTTVSQPAVSLERIKLAYDAMLEQQRREELNPRPESCSANSLLRPIDYDSVGALFFFPMLCCSSSVV